jgi:hypothetical protein
LNRYGDGTSFVIIGDITLTTNPSLDLGNVALCDIGSISCQPLATGLQNYKNLMGIEVSYIEDVHQAIFVSYLGTDDYFYVLEYTYQNESASWNWVSLARSYTKNPGMANIMNKDSMR